MSAYVVSEKTIGVIANAFILYGVDFDADDYDRGSGIFVNDTAQRIGQSLLNQNYRSVNYRYDEDEQAPVFKNNVGFYDFNLGDVFGCIRCYNYQACETDDYFESPLYRSLMALQTVLLSKACELLGFDVPWGID